MPTTSKFNPGKFSEFYINDPQNCIIPESGDNAVVRCISRRSDGVIFVSKTFFRRYWENNERAYFAVNREIEITEQLQREDGKYVVRLQEWFLQDDEIIMVLEYVSGGDLLSFFESHGSEKCINNKNYRPLFLKIAEAIRYIHSKGIIHRDIKPENILLTNNQDLTQTEIKICDFGLSIYPSDLSDSEHVSIKVGTKEYIPPEVIRRQTRLISFKSDIWSLGCVLFTLTTGHFPYPRPHENNENELPKGKPRFPSSWKDHRYGRVFYRLIRGSICRDTSRRMDINSFIDMLNS